MNASGESMIEIDNLTGSNGNDAKTDDKKSIHEWVEVNVDEAVPTRAGGYTSKGLLKPAKQKAWLGHIRSCAELSKRLKPFLKGLTLILNTHPRIQRLGLLFETQTQTMY